MHEALSHDDHWPVDRLLELLPDLRIAVIYGGDKRADGAVLAQRPNLRPWKSYAPVAEDIADALRNLGVGFVTTLPEDMRLAQRLQDARISLAWLNSGGVQGHDPVCHAAALLESLGLPYVGHTPLHAALLDHKPTFKQQLRALGIRTAPFLIWTPRRGHDPLLLAHQIARTFDGSHGPFVVKPAAGRASLHVHYVEHSADLPEVLLDVARATGGQVLVERYLPGREFCVAVGGRVAARGRRLHRSAAPLVFPPLERVLAPGETIFTSMDRRAITADRARPLAPHEAALEAELRELALAVAEGCALEALIRIDVRQDADGQLHVLEANPKPDLARPRPERTSLLAIGLERAGMDYRDLILSQLADRLDRLVAEPAAAPAARATALR